jgi:hypothetical protein
MRKKPSEELRWLTQADRARRLAETLPAADARLLEAFAVECEARAEAQASSRRRAA